jgi:hypothetical protein
MKRDIDPNTYMTALIGLVLMEVALVAGFIVLLITTPSHTHFPGIGVGLLGGILWCFLMTIIEIRSRRNQESSDTGETMSAATWQKVMAFTIIGGTIVSQLLILFLSEDWLAIVGIGLPLSMVIFLAYLTIWGLIRRTHQP